MRRWGIVLTALYAVIMVGMLLPGTVFLSAPKEMKDYKQFRGATLECLHEPMVWLILGIFIASQAILLFLSVDTSKKRLKRQTHIGVSCAVAGALTVLLLFTGANSIGVAIFGDKFFEMAGEQDVWLWAVLGSLGALWLAWGIIFYLYMRNRSNVVRRIVSWLLKGSVLELLIAVPCHVLVRRRDDCCAPIMTGFGIATGIAIMLLSFGPSVLFLYKKRLDGYTVRAGK